MKRIFVYGTLKRGGENHSHLAGQIFLGEARTAAGFSLFALGDFPGMIALAGDRDGVSGEVWMADDTCLARLDELEGVAEGLYRREPILLLPPFAAQSVEAYLYARSTAGHCHLGSMWRG